MFVSLFRYGLIAAVAAAMVVGALAYHPDIRARNAAFTACEREITSTCLIDLGVAEADKRPVSQDLVRTLMRLELYGPAVVLDGGRPPQYPLSAAARRLTMMIRAGDSLKQALDAVPGIEPTSLRTGALDLLTRAADETLLEVGQRPHPQYLDTADRIAELILILAAQKPPRSRAFALMDAAEVYTLLGDRDSVVSILEQLDGTDVTFVMMPEDLLRLVGSQTGMRLYHKAGGDNPRRLWNAALAETDQARAAAFLHAAYDQFAAQDRWPDYSKMERTIKTAVIAGLDPIALDLARDLAATAQTRPGVFPVFPHISAARALMMAGAPEVETRAALTLAESQFPNNREVVGVGLIAGPIGWGGFGLAHQARREIAQLRARLGDIDVAINIATIGEDPGSQLGSVFGEWSELSTLPLAFEHWHPLLHAAEDTMGEPGFASFQARLASTASHPDAPPDQQRWASSKATQLLQLDPLQGERARWFYSNLARTGRYLQDDAMEQAALKRMAQSALITKDPEDLINAGIAWHQSEQLP